MRRDYSSLEDAIENGEGVERPFRCHLHEDRNASASVNVIKGVFYCFSCGGSGRADHNGSQLTIDMKDVLARLRMDTVSEPRPIDWLQIFDADGTHPYWRKRFGDRVAKTWRLGIHPITSAPTYPIIDANNMVQGVVQRIGAPDLKYLYPPNISVSRMLFGYWPAPADIVIVVEGACDAIAVSEALLNFSRVMVVGTYGAGLHLPQVELINDLSPNKVILGFDDDAAGVKAKKRQYPLNADVISISWGAKDPGECSADQIRRVIKKSIGEEIRDGRR